MALVVKDRVMETTSTTGTGTLTLSGAVSGFQSFAAIGDGNTTYYTIYSGTDWEVGIGTYTSAGTTLSRDTVLESSAGGTTKINVASGAQVFVTYPAERSVDTDTAQTLTNKTLDGGTVVTANSSADALRITQTGAGNAILVEDSANPDATPFVVDATGNVLIGDTISRTIPNVTTSKLQVSSEAGNGFVAGLSAVAWDSGSSALAAPVIAFAKSDSDITGTQTIVAANDVLGTISFSGSDGTNFRAASYIQSYVDGTPGTNDMPGRLVFSTTADGASSPTERMRITSSGGVGIGVTPGAGQTLNVGKSITGSTFSTSIVGAGTVQSDVTSRATYFGSFAATAATTFTVSQLIHFYANQGTFGAGSTVSSQYGFLAENSLVNATNNYGFFSNIASGTGRWNFYAIGTAANYFAGTTLIGNTTDRGGSLQLAGSTSSAATTQRITGFAFDSRLRLGRANASETVVASGDSIGILAFDGYDGAAYVPSAQISAVVDGTPGTNDMPGRLVFSTTTDGASSPTERMRIDSAGRVGINTTAGTDTQFQIAGTYVSSGTNTFVVQLSGTAPSTSTNRFTGYRTTLATQATSFTLADLRHYEAAQGTFGAGSTVTNQYGFLANSSLTGATNNFGFYSDIPSATGDWNFYANGTANNAFAGNTSFGTTAAPTVAVDVVGTVQARPAATQDAVAIAGRAGGTGSFVATITPTTLTASRTFTLPDATTTIVGTDTSQTLTNKTLNGAVLNDGYTEEVYAVVDAAGVALSPTNGSIQTWTLGASRTPTAGTWAAGQSMTLMIDDGTAYTVTWTTIGVTWETDAGNAPTLATTGFTVIVLWKVGSTIYGARVGNN